jgi:PhoPQ-activated pathogenicity-related protein
LSISIFPRTAALLAFAGALWGSGSTALDRYVAAPDPNFRYELVKTMPGEGYTAYLLDMTSQAWRTAAEVDRPLWRHWVTIVRPHELRGSTGLLFITGGANDGKPPSRLDPMLTSLAVGAQAVAIELRMVPNQPLTFAGESRPRVEDSLVAYTWDKYLRGADENWPARLPMTKSAVRAMDAATAFCAGEQGSRIKLDRFLVAGGSKRGWTTWTTAAVDRRVVAIAPMVIDLLNLEKSFVHHYRAYGFWAPAVKDYQQMRIMDWMGTPRYRALMKIVEPYEYRDRFTMPKLIMNSTGDQFFLPDSSQFYFDDLPGEKHLRYVPNTSHSLGKSDARETLAAFFASVVQGKPRPRYSWSFERNGAIQVRPVDRPAEVRLWQATNPKARDFRLDVIGPAWTSTPLTPAPDGSYTGKVEKPAQGWTAYMVEMTFSGTGKYPFKFTTGVRVIPDVLPFAAPSPGRPAD